MRVNERCQSGFDIGIGRQNARGAQGETRSQDRTPLRLADRGLLRAGLAADIAIFDPADFKDRATYADPHQYPSGTRTTVIVNGTVVVDAATHTGALPGKVLRRAPDGAVS